MIQILNATEIARARETGALVAEILQTLKGRCTVGTNLLDVDEWARGMIVAAGAQSCYVDYAPSFGSGPFGHYICTSVNDAVLQAARATSGSRTATCSPSTSPSTPAGSSPTRPSASSWAGRSPRRASR